MSALVAAGYRVYAINPRSIDRYRERHHVGGGKSDAGDAKLLADLVRTDRHNHRGFAGATIGGRIASEVLLPKSRPLRHNLLPRGITAGALEGHEAEFVDDQQRHAQVALVQARERQLVARLDQLAHQVGRAHEGDAVPPPGGLYAERDRDVRLALQSVRRSRRPRRVRRTRRRRVVRSATARRPVAPPLLALPAGP